LTYFGQIFKYKILWKSLQWEPKCSVGSDGGRKYELRQTDKTLRTNLKPEYTLSVRLSVCEVTASVKINLRIRILRESYCMWVELLFVIFVSLFTLLQYNWIIWVLMFLYCWSYYILWYWGGKQPHPGRRTRDFALSFFWENLFNHQVFKWQN
jgi:hypothetical protein